MAAISSLSVVQAHAVLTDDDRAVCFDIRDPQSFGNGHIPGAIHLCNDNLMQQLQALDFEQPVLICCYHGISSLQAAQYLVEQGFEQVLNVSGGFEAWQQAKLPVEEGGI